MAFNVAAHVRDDHTKNFAFMLRGHDEWALTPAYDLTFSRGPGGEHTMRVAGEARRPTAQHCRSVVEGVGIGARAASEAIERVNAAVARWPEFADQACCPRAAAQAVATALQCL